MPSTYAHEKFGRLVLRKLPESYRKAVMAWPDLYHIGLQGPDIFYYYDPLDPHSLSDAADAYHEMSGREFFRKAAGILKEGCSSGRYHRQDAAGEEAAGGKEADEDNQADKGKEAAGGKEADKGKEACGGRLSDEGTGMAGQSYLMGVLCHFTLDSMCHGYIRGYEERGVSHSVIEGEFDRFLIAGEGREPVRENLVKNFRPAKDTAKVAASFYPKQGLRIVEKSLQNFVRLHHLLYCPESLKRNVLYALLRLIGQYDSFRGHIISPKPEPGCEESNLWLRKRMKEAVPTAVRLITEFPDSFDDPQYDWNFDGTVQP